jgi:predicted AlkP superfamily pyrophosphatase or phosphodiesterase
VYTLSREDDFPAEDDSTDAAFPHLFDVAVPDPEEYPDSVAHPEPWHYSRLRYTPFPDHMTFELARQLVKEERLGADDAPDLLLIGASSGDYIGHDFGPLSWEMQDYYHHLDGLLGELFEFLDEEVGSGAYAVVLTADHGVALLAEEAARQGMDAARIGTTEFQAPLLAGLQLAMLEEQIYGQPRLSSIYPFGLKITFTDGIPGEPVTEEQMRGLRRIVADSLRTAEVLEDVFTYNQLKDGTSDSPYFEWYRRSFHPDRAADLVLRLKENYTTPRSLRGNHGSPYEYDTHVPLIVIAPGIERSTVDRPIATVSVAPTVAALLGITPPGDLDGEALSEVTGSR